jgi:H+-transporting ATPase
MFQIGNFLIALAVVLALIMVTSRVYQGMFVSDQWNANYALGILQFVLVLLVASIPVAMPAVFSITMALGALGLSKQKAIVSKLSAIEEMAGVDILCSDKTGTLTQESAQAGRSGIVRCPRRTGMHPGRRVSLQTRGSRRHR